MARTSAPGRLEEIGDAALNAFSELGFKRAQMADIAKRCGVAPGTLYLYGRSKEALFWMALQRALGEEMEQAPEESELLDQVRGKLHLDKRMPLLFGMWDEMAPPLNLVLSEIWDSIEKLAPAIRLVERCAQDWPELAALFYLNMRPVLLQQLAEYLDNAADDGLVRRVHDIPMAARLIVETIAWFAIHRHGDADGRFFESASAKAATMDALVHAYGVPEVGAREFEK